MRKLSLTLEALRVDSFETGALAGLHGTVHGNDSRITEFCQSRSCPPCQVVDVPPPPLGAVEAPEAAA